MSLPIDIIIHGDMHKLKQDGVDDRFKSWVTFNAPILVSLTPSLLFNSPEKVFFA